MDGVSDSTHRNVPQTAKLVEESKGGCTPKWMYNMADGLVNAFSVDELPEGYATGVAYGERFRHHDYSALLTYYPILIFLLILGALVTLGGIFYWTFRCYERCRIHVMEGTDPAYTRNWRLVIGFFILLFLIVTFFGAIIMVAANWNMSEENREHAKSLKLLDKQMKEVYENIEMANKDVLLHKFNKFALQFQETARSKADSYLHRSSTGLSDFDYNQYERDVQDVLEAFANCSNYMLYFFDTWRYYAINATRFANYVNSSESKNAIKALLSVKTDFAAISYKLMQQYKAYFQYSKALEKVSKNLRIINDFEERQSNKLNRIVDYYLYDLNGAINKIGSKLRNIADRLSAIVTNMRDTSKNTFYIEFPSILHGIGWLMCIIIFFILICIIIAVPMSIWGWDANDRDVIFGKYVAIYLLQIIIGLIFVCYLLLILVLMFYFLYGMVAHDGICTSKPQSRLIMQRPDLYSDCMANMTIFDIAKTHRLINDPDFEQISRAALLTIDGLQRRLPSLPLLQLERNIQRPQINRTNVEDIYVKMLQIVVYAPKNIEAFGAVWRKNVRNVSASMPELVCAHAIGVTMVDALRGQVSREVDKMYRSTWKVAEALQRLAQINNDTAIVSKIGNYVTQVTRNLSRDLHVHYVAEKERLSANITEALQNDTGRCAPMAQLYSTLRAPACDRLVPSMNTFWFGAFLVVLFLLPLLCLLLLLTFLTRWYYPDDCDLPRYNSNQANRERAKQAAVASRIAAEKRAAAAKRAAASKRYAAAARAAAAEKKRRRTEQLTETAKTSDADAHFCTPKRAYTHPRESVVAAKRWPVFPDSYSPTSTRSTTCAGYIDPELADFDTRSRPATVNMGLLLPEVRIGGRDDTNDTQRNKMKRYPSAGRVNESVVTFELPPMFEPSPMFKPSRNAEPLERRHTHPRARSYQESLPRSLGGNTPDVSATCLRPRAEHSRTMSQAKLNMLPRRNTQPKTFGRNYDEPPGSQQETEEPSTSKAAQQLGSLTLILCPCGCGRPTKIIGDEQEIQRLQMANTICIADRTTGKQHTMQPVAFAADQLEQQHSTD